MKKIKFEAKKLGNQHIFGEKTDSDMYVSFGILDKVPESERLHSHTKTVEFYVFLSGEGKFQINGEIIDVCAGDAIEVDIGEVHKLYSVSEVLTYFVVKKRVGDDRIFHD